MHKTDGAGHLNNTFVNENPSTSTPASIVDAAWLNAVQAEIVNVIEAAGITLNKANNAQLLQALKSIAIAAGVAANPGYMIFPFYDAVTNTKKKFVLQFGLHSSASTGVITVNYPIAFDVVISVTASAYATQTTGIFSNQWVTGLNGGSSFSLYKDTSASFSWIAIGTIN